MKKLLFILFSFFAVAACDDNSACTPVIETTPTTYEVGANTGGTYAFTTDVPAYVAGYVHFTATMALLGRNENKWERPKTLPATLEQGWFSVTQLTDTTFEVTIDKEHDSSSILEISLYSYVPGGPKSDGRIIFYLR